MANGGGGGATSASALTATQRSAAVRDLVAQCGRASPAARPRALALRSHAFFQQNTSYDREKLNKLLQTCFKF